MVIADPPLLDDGVKAIDTWVSLGVALRPVGAFGVVTGIAVNVGEAVPVPTELTARSPIVYVVPLARPVIVAGLAVTAGLNTVQLAPPSVVYS